MVPGRLGGRTAAAVHHRHLAVRDSDVTGEPVGTGAVNNDSTLDHQIVHGAMLVGS